jgi:pimeloyl-ACP methyl ester carboxylesterase
MPLLAALTLSVACGSSNTADLGAGPGGAAGRGGALHTSGAAPGGAPGDVGGGPSGVFGAGGGGSGGQAGAADNTPEPFTPGRGPGSIHQLSLTAPDRPVERGDFSLYVPSEVTKLRGVLVHQHGCGRNGISMPYDLHWQALANRHGLALMGTEFPTLFADGDHCARWSRIENGSLDLYTQALEQLGAMTQHPELAAVPWVLWGHSGGASWAFQVAKAHPDRVVAVVMKSICEGFPPLEPELMAVPMLIATGPDDFEQCYLHSPQTFAEYRAAGAPWALVDEPGGTHECKNLRYLAIPYLDALLELRLRGSNAPVLTAVEEATGFLGDNASKSVSAALGFAGNRDATSWLPNERVAAMWREFLMTRDVSDSTTPVIAPTELAFESQGGELALRWRADADLESGIGAFKLYRDGSLLLQVPSGAEAFQGFNYGDEPEPVMPMMRATSIEPGHLYSVSLVNRAGLESPKSDAVMAN